VPAFVCVCVCVRVMNSRVVCVSTCDEFSRLRRALACTLTCTRRAQQLRSLAAALYKKKNLATARLGDGDQVVLCGKVGPALRLDGRGSAEPCAADGVEDLGREGCLLIYISLSRNISNFLKCRKHYMC
jgi:hypothetical protein